MRTDGGGRKGLPVPRPLYNLPMLYERPDAPVLVMGGEKTSDAVRDLLPSYIPTTSMFGGNSTHLSDWTPLKGGEVVVWPDNDPDGQNYARSLSEKQCSKRYASLVECKDANYSTTKSRVL